MRQTALPTRPALRHLPRTAASLLVLIGCGALQPAALAAPPGTILPPGTVPQLRGVVSGAVVVNAPVPTPTGQLLNINQFAPRVVIDWNSFNIGSGSEVRFNQPDSSAAALNRIYDRDPSIIQGRLTANGQVYLLNQNGILFDRGSQVNVNTLIASTLNITQERFLSGIIGGAAFDGATPGSEIRVGTHGPSDQAAQLVSQPGGAIMLFAPKVTVDSGGIIRAPDGQVILAAGNRVFLQNVAGDFSLRGLRVEINADSGPVNLTSLIQNLGDISSDRGNVTMVGLAINQMNRVSASSAVLTNGSIYLKARELPEGQILASRTGTVVMGPGSVTEAPLDTTDTTQLTQDQAFQFRPTVRVDGNSILSQGRVTAPGGEITFTAVGPGAEPGPTRIYVDAGSVVSVAGNWADLPASSNVLSVRLTSDSLADSPVQRGGILQGETVAFDVRRGKPPILSQSSFDANVGGVQRSVAEKATAGGDLTLDSTGDVILRAGATLDVSGGGLRYAPGPADTTLLVTEDRRVFDFSTAPKDLRYIGILNRFERTYEQWGQVDLFTNYLPGRLGLGGASFEGAAAGALNVRSTLAVLEGDVRRTVSAHANQIAANRAPAAARLVVGDAAEIDVNRFPFPGFRIGDLRIGAPAGVSAALGPDAAPGAFGTTTVVPDSWLDATPRGGRDAYVHDSFGQVSLYASGRIDIPAGVTVNLPPQGTLTAYANRIGIEGSVVAPGGAISLNSRSAGSNPDQRGTVAITGGTLSTAGLWINDVPATDGLPPGPLLPRQIDGGRVAISTVDGLIAGDLIDVSGGARLVPGSSRSVTAGRGGSITIETGLGTANELFFGDLAISSPLAGFAARDGGSVTLRGRDVTIGAAPPGANPQRLVVSPELFSQGGFRSYTVNAFDRLEIQAGAVIRPTARSAVVDPVAAAQAPSGTPIANLAQPADLPILPPNSPSGTLGRNPVNVAFNVTNSLGGTLEMKPGSAILAEPLATVALNARTGMEIAGTIVAPGGSITLGLPFEAAGQLGGGTLRLASGAVLDASGTFLARGVNDRGFQPGEVLPGGIVTLRATKNDLVTERGSLIRVDGATAAVDLSAPVPDATPVRRETVASEAGTVRILGTERLVLDGDLSAAAPAGTAGGSFALDFVKHGDGSLVERDHRVVLGAGAPSAAPTLVTAQFDPERLESAGFDKLRVAADRIELQTGVSIDMARSIRLDTPSIVVAGAGAAGTARVSAPRVTLANSGGGAALVAGANTLRVDASLIDLYGALTVGGVEDVFLSSSGDLRVTGIGQVGNVLPGSLTSPGNLHLSAAQIYPTTLTDFTFAVGEGGSGGVPITNVPDGRITVTSSGGAAGPVLSAGGRLAFAADVIEQGGRVKAPLGTIDFTGDRIALGAGSLTSVSADGLTVPYGGTIAGRTWRYNGIVDDVAAPPAKRISLAGRDVSVGEGATVDLSGGGEIQGAEFVRGSGGSEDALVRAPRADEAAFTATYAILPGYGLAFEAFDTDTALRRPDLGFGPLLASDAATADRAIYDSVYLSGGAGVPAGTYALLPGYYALLPGAYAVRPLTGSTYRDAELGRPQTLANGTTVVPGFRTVAGTDKRESRTSGFLVLSGDQVRRESEYRIETSRFFADQAVALDKPLPRLPADAGALVLSATGSLALDGTLVGRTGAPDARRAQVDIDATRIAIVDTVGQPGIDPGVLQIAASRLSNLDASVLVGATRRDRADGRLDIVVGASDVTVANAASALAGSEIVLAATDTVTLAPGANVRAAGAASESPDYVVAGDGALLRAAAGAPVAIDRTPAPTRARGDLVIASGASVSATGALQLDATRNTSLFGATTVGAGGALGVASGRVSLGETAAITDGLVLSNSALAGLASAGSLVLTSYGTIDFYGDTRFGGPTLDLTLDGAGLLGYAVGGRSSTAIAARSVTLANTAGSRAGVPAGGVPDGNGAFVIDAGAAVIAGGAKSAEGFSAFTVNASGEIAAAGEGTLTVAAPVSLNAARIAADSGARQSIEARSGSGAGATYFDVTLGRPAAPAALAPAEGAGGRLAVAGKSVRVGTDIESASGRIELSARGPDAGDGVFVAPGARVAAEGASRTYQDGAAAAVVPAGTVLLNALAGPVEVAPGGTVSVAGTTVSTAAGALSGDAGALEIAAASVLLGGTIDGRAAPGRAGGEASIDVGALPSFAALNAPLEAGGFTAGRTLRVRSGDVVIDQDVRSATFAAAADAGAIVVSSRIDASGATGGTITLDAGTRAVLLDSARLDASGSAGGGRVRIAARDGAAGGNAVAFAAGAAIDVSARERGDAGEVVFAAPRSATAVDASLLGTVAGAAPAGGRSGEIVVEGWRSYAVTTINTGAGSAYATEYAAFMASATRTAVLDTLQRQGIAATDAHVRAGIELRSAGDLTLTSPWDLTAPEWNAAGEPGHLALRSTGTLTIRNALGLPSDELAAGPGWSLTLVGGADLAGASRLAVRPSATTGDVVIANAGGANVGKVRTSTGDIAIAAGRDFVLQDPPGTVPSPTASAAVVYTSGVAVPGVPAQPNGQPDTRYAESGGDISIYAARDARGATRQLQWINDWLRRSSATASNQAQRDALIRDGAGWWVERADFRHNVGTLAGGDISIRAGNDVDGLSAMLPTLGRIVSTQVLDVTGGGDLTVVAGNDIRNAEFLVARGDGSLRAGGAIGTRPAATPGGTPEQAPVALYLMGESDDAATRGASFAVTAAGDVRLQNVSNPTIMAAPGTINVSRPGFQNGRTAFFTYTPESELTIASAGGDVFLGNRAAANRTGLNNTWSEILPSKVAIASLRGDVESNFAFVGTLAPSTLFPDADSRLVIAAAGDVRGWAVEVPNAVPEQVPAWNRLAITRPGAANPTLFLGTGIAPLSAGTLTFSPTFIPQVMTRADAPVVPYTVVAGGDLYESRFNFPRDALVQAGGDIENVNFRLQNIGNYVSRIVAGRDIRYTDLTRDGLATPPQGQGVEILGAGALLMQAGRNIDMGRSFGVNARGNEGNTSITASDSADVVMVAGLTTPGAGLDLARIGPLFEGLIQAGLENRPSLGDEAAEKAFAGSTIGPGSITTVLSPVQTFGGSDIVLLAPQGDIIAGLTVPTTSTTGVQTLRGGAVLSYLSGDFDVNQAKVLTARGGDIVIYTRDGSIDAGRGALTSRTTTPPTVIRDANGTLIGFDLGGDVAGAGIRTVTSDPDGPGPQVAPPAGNVFLFALRGTVDAGEAGIAGGSNVTIAAVQVLNASNVQGAGAVSGVPTAGVSAAAAGASAASAGAAASRAAESVAQRSAEDSKPVANDAFRPSFISVEVLGFGDEEDRRNPR